MNLEEAKKFVRLMCVNDEMPEMNYCKMSIEERRKMDMYMTTVCHDTVNDWKKLHNV